MRSPTFVFRISIGIIALFIMSPIPPTKSNAAPTDHSDRRSSSIGQPALSEPTRPTTDGYGFSEGLIPIQVNDLYGYIDMTGTMVIPPQFTSAFSFKEGLARVRLPGGNKEGFADKTGTMIIPPQFVHAENFHEGLAAVMFDLGNHSTFIDRTGKVVAPYFGETWDFSEGFARVTLDWRSEKYGFIDKTGALVIPAEFGYAYPVPSFSEGMALVGGEGNNFNRKLGYIDTTGKVVIPFQFSYALPFSDGLATVAIGTGINTKYGCIDKAGHLVIPAQYDYPFNFRGGLGRVNIEQRTGYIDTTGTFVITMSSEFPNSYAIADFSEGLAVVQSNGRSGYIDKAGKFTIPLQFESARNFSEGLAKIQLDGKIGFIDKTGTIVIPTQF